MFNNRHQVHGQSDLLRHQNAERLAGERELAAGERNALDALLAEDEVKRNATVNDMSDKLATKLQGELYCHCKFAVKFHCFIIYIYDFTQLQNFDIVP